MIPRRSRLANVVRRERGQDALSAKQSRQAASELVRLIVLFNQSQVRPQNSSPSSPDRNDGRHESLDHARLAAIVESSQDAIIGITLGGIVEDWNQAAEKMLGYSALEAIGASVFELIVPPECQAEEADILARVMRGEWVPRLYTRRRRRDGGLFDASVTVSPIRGNDGRIVGAAKVLRDMSPEMAFKAALSLSQARLAAIVESSEDAIIGKTLDGVVTDWNLAAEKMFGYARQDAIGRTIFELIVPSGHESEEADILARVTRGEAVPHFYTRRRRRDGSLFDVSVTVSPIRDSDGQIVGAAKVLRDMTVEIAARTTAENAANTKAEFLAAMSHELRTPLHSIIGFSSLMLESGELGSETVRRQARLIHDASETLLSIIKDVLDISKLDASKFDLDPRPFSPRGLLRSVLDLLRGQAERRGLSLRMEFADDIPACLVGDEPRLRQILLNLTSNALKFTAKGEVCVTAAMSASVMDKIEIKFSVTDTGIGIPESHHHRIFQRFSQVDGSTSRRYGGTGLGLSICKSLVELMSGAIGFESRPGVGSHFWCTIAFVIADTQPQEEALDVEIHDTARSAFILVAEDVEVNQELAVLLLCKLGHRADVVADGSAAIDAVQRKAYDLVLMDIQMPTMDGIEATVRIRALGGAYSKLPIVATTAAALREDIARYKQAGMDDYLSKPFLPSQLTKIINLRSLRAETNRSDALSEPAPPPTGANDERVTGSHDPPGEFADSSALDQATFDGLANQIGADRAVSLVRRFALDLAKRFAQCDDHETLRKDAHAMVSSARALGFARLSRAAKAVEVACQGKGEVETDLANLLAARTEASELIATRFA